MAYSAAIATSLSGYSTEEVQKYFISPLFFGSDDYLNKFTLYTDIKSSMKLDHFSAVEYITQANAGSAFQANAGQSAYTQKNLVVGHVEAEMEQRASTFFSTVKSQALKLGTAKDNIDGTVVKEIMAGIMMQGIKRDFHRQLWLAAAGAASGTDANASAVDLDYAVYDGIFEVLADSSCNKLVVDTSGGGTASSGCEVNALGALTNAEVLALLNATYNAMSPELKSVPKTLYVSGVVADAYMKYLREQQLEASFIYLQDGTPANLTFAGIPIVVRRDWDVHIANDFALITGASAAGSTIRLVLAADNAIVVGSDFDSAGVENWYSLDQQSYRMRFGYKVGCQLMDDKLAVTCLSV